MLNWAFPGLALDTQFNQLSSTPHPSFGSRDLLLRASRLRDLRWRVSAALATCEPGAGTIQHSTFDIQHLSSTTPTRRSTIPSGPSGDRDLSSTPSLGCAGGLVLRGAASS